MLPDLTSQAVGLDRSCLAQIRFPATGHVRLPAAFATAEPNLPGANGLRRNLNVSGIGACKAEE
jgi:hypothetical protein